MHRAAVHRRRKNFTGFTLLEVLVAILVLSIGVMGVVGLQAASLQTSRDSGNQVTAMRMAAELADLMRANHYVASATANNPYLMDVRSAPANVTTCFRTGCTTPQDVARSDVADWVERLGNDLPAYRVVVCSDSAPYDNAGLPVWNCTAGGPMVIKIGWSRPGYRRAGAVTDDAETTSVNQAIRPSVMVAVSPGA